MSHKHSVILDMASGANYSPLREEPTDRLDFDDSNSYPQDDGPYPNAGNPRVQTVGRRGLKGSRGCSKLSAIMLLCMVIIAILLIAVIASLARPQCVPSIESTGPPTSAPTPAVSVFTTPPATATNGEPFPWSDIRLPKALKPVHYDLLITTDLTNFKVTGTVTIHFVAVSATDFIVMHVKNMTLTKPKEVTASSKGGQSRSVTEMLISENYEQVYFGLDGTLLRKSKYTITLDFMYELRDTLSGYYLSSYVEEGSQRFIASTQFEPTAARRAFPCFDEPALKATFAMRMRRAKDLISLFNTARISTTEVGENLKEDVYNTTVPMSTYLVAFAVCDFANISSTSESGTAIAVYTSRGKIEQARLALDVLQKTIIFYEDFFGVKYPLSKQDMVAIPDFSAGAMENWGLIMYREASILYQEGVTSSSQKQWIVQTITHELAHQWFGNLVTMEWWNDLWLNEGFATYVEYIGTDNYNKQWQMMDQFTVFTTQSALEADSHSNSHPISVNVKNPNEINEIFDSISYDKGSALIYMLREFLPSGAFVQGLTAYLLKFQYRNAQTKDLWDAMSEAYKRITETDTSISDMMDTWTLQMGYPVVTLTRRGSRVTATQKHFLHSTTAQPTKAFPSPYNYTWTIPLTYITSDDATKKSVTMDRKEATKQLSLGGNVKWYKVNSNQSGFYRVNYDDDNWDALIQQLKKDHTQLSTADRANLVDDAFSLAWAGQLDQTIPLQLSLYLLNETEYGPLNSALANINKIGRVMRNTNGYTSYVDYTLKLLTPQLDFFSKYDWGIEGTHLQSFLKNVVMYDAVVLGHVKTVEFAKELFREWRQSSNYSVPANLKSAVYCAGIMYGSRDDWDFCWAKYSMTLVASEKRDLLAALACTHDPYLINRYLFWSMDEDKVPSQDTGTVISRVASHPAGAYPALAFVIENWDTLIQRYEDSPFELTYIIDRVTSPVARQFQYDQASKFFLDHFSDSKTGKRAIQQALENMQANIAWLKAHKDKVAKWFAANSS